MKKLMIDNKEIEVLNDIELSSDIDFISDYISNINVFEEYRNKVACFRKIIKINNCYSDINYCDVIRDIYYNLPLEVGVLRSTLYSMIGYTNTIDTLIDNFKGSRSGDKLNNLKNFISKYNNVDNVNTNLALDYIANTYNKSCSYYLLSNDILDIATCSYKHTYRSCYSIENGEYNNSVNYIINDNLHSDKITWCVLYQLNINNLEDLDLSQSKLYDIAINRKFITYDNDTNVMLLGANYGNKEFNKKGLLLEVIHKVIFGDNVINYNNYVVDNSSSNVCYWDNGIKCYRDYDHSDCYIYYDITNNSTIKLWGCGYSDFIDVNLPVCACCGELITDEDNICYIDGEMYCCDCCYYCDNCGEYFLQGEGVRVNGCYYCDNCIDRV